MTRKHNAMLQDFVKKMIFYIVIRVSITDGVL